MPEKFEQMPTTPEKPESELGVEIRKELMERLQRNKNLLRMNRTLTPEEKRVN